MNKPLEKCTGVHCRCMNLGGQCPNHHYADCESRIEKEAVISTNKEVRSVEEIVDEFWKKYDHGDTFQMASMMEFIRTTLTAERTAQREMGEEIKARFDYYGNAEELISVPNAAKAVDVITKRFNIEVNK